MNLSHVAIVMDTLHNILGVFSEMQLAEESISQPTRVVSRSFERTHIINHTGKQYIIIRMPVQKEAAPL